MDEEIESLMVSVRADTSVFKRDIAEMRSALDGPLAAGAEKAGRALENALIRAVRTGKLSFEDLKRVALSVMAEIAAAAIRRGIGAVLAGGGGKGAGAAAGSLIAGLVGAPGRATGGPVAPGRAYMVGERGPELFVPTASGRVEAGSAAAREIRMNITINASPGAEPQAFAASGRQVARAVKQALMRVE
jgi:phage-related minor tail protein